MKVSYYPGCSLHATGKEYGQSVRAVSKALGIELKEIDDWSCCGATSAHSTNFKLSIALPARDLIAAERDDITSIEKVRSLATLFKDATLVEIPKVGHLIHYETPDAAARAIGEFLALPAGAFVG